MMFLDADEARAHANARRDWLKSQRQRRRDERPSLRQSARICIPGIVINRAVSTVVGAVLNPVVLAGPEAAKWLERRVERLLGISSPSRSQRWMLGAAQWLLAAPETEPEPTEYQLHPLADAIAAALAQSALRRAGQKPDEAGSACPEAGRATGLSGSAGGTDGDPDQTDQGVR